jgi:hypothetical protein
MGSLRIAFVTAFLFVIAICPNSYKFAESAALAALAESKPSFAQIMRLADSERKPAYMKMAFQPDGWIAGKVLSRKPYSVIISADSAIVNGDIAYQLQIWRGVAMRVEDDLLTKWDLLELNAKGKVIQATEGYERALTGYFKAPSQYDFRTIEDVQRYPWANLPTDSEAKAAHIAPIPKDGSIDVYGILPREGSFAISKLEDKVKPLLVIPAQLLDRPPAWWQSSPDLNIEPAVPVDITSHWAKDFIIDLMKKSIIVGYEDQTIHPNGILTKAEFTAMLVRSLDLDLIDGSNGSNGNIRSNRIDGSAGMAGFLSDGTVAGFTDMPGHWAKHEVDIALESELIKIDPFFYPDAPISRVETVRIVANAFQTMQATYKQAAPLLTGSTIADGSSHGDSATVVPVWNDLQSISQEDADFIAPLAAEGIISGDPDGNFRPDDSLTRAEASKVLSLFLKLK